MKVTITTTFDIEADKDVRRFRAALLRFLDAASGNVEVSLPPGEWYLNGQTQVSQGVVPFRSVPDPVELREPTLKEDLKRFNDVDQLVDIVRRKLAEQ